MRQGVFYKNLLCACGESVLRRIHKNTDPTGADDLRNVYLEARYDERQNISRKQVDQAKRALKASHKKK